MHRHGDVTTIGEDDNGYPGAHRSESRESLRPGQLVHAGIQYKAAARLRPRSLAPGFQRRQRPDTQTRRSNERRERITDRRISADNKYRHLCNAPRFAGTVVYVRFCAHPVTTRHALETLDQIGIGRHSVGYRVYVGNRLWTGGHTCLHRHGKAEDWNGVREQHPGR